MEGLVLVHQPAVDPHAGGAARAQVQHGRARLGGAQHGRGVERDVAVGGDGSREIDVPEREQLRRQGAPADLVVLAGISCLGGVAVLLRTVDGAQAAPTLVLEWTDHRPRPHRRDPVDRHARLRKLSLGDRDLRAEQHRRRPEVGTGAPVGRHPVESPRERSQVRHLLAQLVQPEQVGQRTGALQLAEDARREEGRVVAVPAGRGSERQQQEREGGGAASHAGCGLPGKGQSRNGPAPCSIP